MHIDKTLPKKILAWYDNSKRKLPWRVGKKSPKKLYYRLLSEFMLQQTQVKTVIPYFNKFTKKLKTIKALSKSNERIKKLPGIGDYTANALLGLVYNEPRIAVDGNVRRVFSRNLNIEENKINFDKFIRENKKKFFITKRNDDFVEALMEFGALICKPKDPNCLTCCLNKTCKYFKSSEKIKNIKNKMIKSKNYDIFCYINTKKQIALTKNNQISFLKDFNIPEIKETNNVPNNQNWIFLKNYKNSISNLKLNINLYYKFSKKIPRTFNWYSLKENKEFIPSFTKRIFRQVSTLF